LYNNRGTVIFQRFFSEGFFLVMAANGLGIIFPAIGNKIRTPDNGRFQGIKEQPDQIFYINEGQDLLPGSDVGFQSPAHGFGRIHNSPFPLGHKHR